MANAEFVLKDHSGAFLAAVREAQTAGLQAGINVLRNAVKRGLRGGYTSGDFTQGIAWNSITVEPPVFDGEGNGFIRCGTALDYPMYWELGHHNVFTRKFERVEIWAPAYQENMQAAREAYERAFRATLSHGAAAGSGAGEGSE